MTILTTALSVPVLLVGVLIGSAGIGGVLLVPVLHLWGGMSLHQAIPACMMGYVTTGLVGTWVYMRRGTVSGNLALSVCIGAIPGAYLGAWLLSRIAVDLLSVIVGLFVLSSGIHALASRPSCPESGFPPPRTGTLIAIGLVCGAGSALTGTGGPLLLIPLLIWRQVPVFTAIGLSQVIQIPIAVMATAGNLAHGQTDFGLGAALAALLGVGAYIGAVTAHALPVRIMEKPVSAILIAAGSFITYRGVF